MAPTTRAARSSPASSHSDNDTDQVVTAAASSSNPADSDRSHQCPDCGKRFQRREHMQRHLNTHNNSFPFQCHICHRAFQRSDVLRRHSRMHESRVGIKQASLNPRQRSALHRTVVACKSCSRMKLKCDGKRPSCSRCLRSPGRSCTYAYSPYTPSLAPHQHDEATTLAPPHPSSPAPDQSHHSPSPSPESARSTPLSTPPHSSLPPQSPSPSSPASPPSIRSPPPPQLEPDPLSYDNLDPQLQFDHQHHQVPSVHSPAHLQSRPPPPPEAGLYDINTVEGILTWLDGPLTVDSQSQIDWSFGGGVGGGGGCRQLHSRFGWAQSDDETLALIDTWHSSLLAQPASGQPGTIATDSSSHPTSDSDAPLSRAVGATPLQLLSDAAVLNLGGPSAQALSAAVSLEHPDHLVSDQNPDRYAFSRSGARSRWQSPQPDASNNDASVAGHASQPPPAAAQDHRGENGSSRPWPNRWNPVDRFSKLDSFFFANADEAALMMEDSALVPPLDEFCKQRICQSLLCGNPDSSENKKILAAFERLTPDTLNIYLQLFFQHFDPIFPFIHQPTFSPARADPRLLAVICSVGAMYSKLDGARHCGIVMAALAQRSLSELVTNNNAYSRYTATFQAFTLIFLLWRNLGSPARLEQAEAYRSTYTTMIRRIRVLDDIPPPRPRNASLEERWRAWLVWEAGRRVGWAVLISETELSISWNLPSAFVADELKGALPCDQSLWNAATAEEWEARLNCYPENLSASSPDSFSMSFWKEALTLPSACQLLNRPELSDRSDPIRSLHPFAKLCLASGLYLVTQHTYRSALGFMAFPSTAKQILNDMRSLLSAALSRFDDCSAAILLHASQLFLLVDTEDLQMLSGRRGTERMAAAASKLQYRFGTLDPHLLPMLVYHSGQMFRLTRESRDNSPGECIMLFYAAACLFSVVRHVIHFSVSDQPTTPRRSTLTSRDSIVRIAAGVSPPSPTKNRGGEKTIFILHGVGNLHHPLASEQVLKLAIKRLRDTEGAASIWPIGQSLAKILETLLQQG